MYGNGAWDRLGLGAGQNAKQQMLTLFQRELGCRNVVFVDDDLANFPQLSRAKGRRCVEKLGCFALQAGGCLERSVLVAGARSPNHVFK